MTLHRELPSPAEAAKLDQVNLWLIRRQAKLAASVLRMGHVRFCDLVETAGVRVTGSEVDLFFNRAFFDSLKLVELTAVLLHEALHVVFRHQARAERIASNWERRLFSYACEAVVNDVIARYFPHVVLPGDHITGQFLVGRNTSDLSAEQVMHLLSEKAVPVEILLSGTCVDDHDVWDPGERVIDRSGASVFEAGPARWTSESNQLTRDLLISDPRIAPWGSEPLGAPRLAPRFRGRADLRRFLLEKLRPAYRYATIWSKPNRKAMALYPDVILPVYDPETWMVRVLMAIDTSGSVSNEFLGVARAVAHQHIPGTQVRLVSFDTVVYEAQTGAYTLLGGGGTDAGAVERYIRDKLPIYPDWVFLFTDGLTPPPKPLHPDRWVWLLPPDGSEAAIPPASPRYRFDPREMR